jgi:hypothetical protein
MKRILEPAPTAPLNKQQQIDGKGEDIVLCCEVGEERRVCLLSESAVEELEELLL